MKKRLLIVCLFCLSSTAYSCAASKLNPDKHHFISIYGGIGAQGLLNNAFGIQNNIGVAPAVGVGYRYFINGFILQVGFEGEYTYLVAKLKDQQLSLPCIDSEHEAFILHSSFTQGKERIRTASIFAPVMIGFEKRKFYGLAGAKVGMSLYGTTRASSLVSSQAEYEKYIDYFSQMPSHNLMDNVPLRSENYSLKWATPMLLLHLELGGRLDKPDEGLEKHLYRIYLGIYADYGILNIYRDNSIGSRINYIPNEEQGIGTFKLLPYMLSNEMLGRRINPLTIGVKFTCLIEKPAKRKCIICDL